MNILNTVHPEAKRAIEAEIEEVVNRVANHYEVPADFVYTLDNEMRRFAANVIDFVERTRG